MALPAEAEALRNSLIKEYGSAWNRVTSQIGELASDPKQATKLNRLGEVRTSIEREMNRLDQVASKKAGAMVTSTAEQGWVTGKIAGGASLSADFTMVNRGAVAAYSQGLTDKLLIATNGVKTSTRSLITSIARDEGLQSLIQGSTAQDAGKAMAARLSEHGLWAVRYTDGSRHGLAEYCEMAMRTTTGEAYNNSFIEGAVSEGVQWFEVFDGPDCGWEFHDDPHIAEGLIVSASDSTSHPLAHPNCRRAFGARPDVKSKKDAAAASKSTTQEQMDAQRKQDAARRELQRRQANARARLARKQGPKPKIPEGFFAGPKGPKPIPGSSASAAFYKKKATGIKPPAVTPSQGSGLTTSQFGYYTQDLAAAKGMTSQQYLNALEKAYKAGSPAAIAEVAAIKKAYAVKQAKMTAAKPAVKKAAAKPAATPAKSAGGSGKYRSAEGDRSFTDPYEQWAKNLTRPERQAVTGYTGTDYEAINRRLRMDGGRTSTRSQRVMNMDSALAKGSAPRDVQMHRGTTARNLVEAFDRGEYRPGGTFVDHGFMSTSANPSVSDSFGAGRGIGFRVNIPKGSPGAYVGHISAFSHNEAEFIIPRGTPMRITSVTREGGRRIIEMEVTQ